MCSRLGDRAATTTGGLISQKAGRSYPEAVQQAEFQSGVVAQVSAPAQYHACPSLQVHCFVTAVVEAAEHDQTREACVADTTEQVSVQGSVPRD